MPYKKILAKEFNKPYILGIGDTLRHKINFEINPRFSYKLRIRGEVNIPYETRTEDLYPIYFRKLEDSLIKNTNGYSLEFNEINYAHERSAYYMLTDELDINKEYSLNIKVKAKGIQENFKVTAEVYYGEKRTRYYYEQADVIYTFDVNDSDYYVEYKKTIKFDNAVDFIVIKISAIDFNGTASVFTPKLVCGNKTFVEDFEFAPGKLGDQKWIGEGFSHTEYPTFSVKLNGEEIFNGKKTDRLHRLAGVEFNIPDNLLKEENDFEIMYLQDNKVEYAISELQILTLPKELEILGVQKYQNVNKQFGVFCYLSDGALLTIDCDEELEFIDRVDIDEHYCVLKFLPKAMGKNKKIAISNGKEIREVTVNINQEKLDNVITGSGDFIYINQNFEDFCEYISWFITEGIGDMLTLRSSYRWGCTSEYDENFWRKAVKILKAVGLYYVLMVDGRELNGVNANPTKEILESEYFLGEQTHERDGAFTYWTQNVSEYEAFFYHLLSRKLKRNGIYGKFSPVYDNNGNPRIFYAGDDICNVQYAYESLVNNLKRTAADGATRHTGVTPLFSAFFNAGYKWLGYESMYGNHEIIFGALRGMSNSLGKNSFGAHLALQWSTVPCDDDGHVARYKLSLYESFMQGATQINTEEGLWNIENPFEGFDRFSYACTEHKKAQQAFNRFVKTHNRKGRQVRNIAMMVGRYDGMDCFSTGRVYGQKRDYWEYSTPEESWDLLKVFYPQAKIGAIYHFVKKGGHFNLREKDKKFLEAWPDLYGGKALNYQSLGYYSETPYGLIDIIDSKAGNLSDYDFIFLTGWNSCDEEQLIRFCNYLENGGTLMLAQPHLYDSINREEVFTHKAKIIDSPYVQRLLAYREKGRLIYFDNRNYPIDFQQEYEAELKKACKRFSSKLIKQSNRVSFTEYVDENGATFIYAINIGWWEEKPATIKISLSNVEHTIAFADNDMKLIAVSPSQKTAILVEGIDIDISSIDDDSVVLKGYGNAKITLYGDDIRCENIYCNGVKIISFR